ncbi:MAG: 1-acyl-sn-glycerol-3-phosphate acyltransferase [Bacteriovoracaceae bacterium]|nr:1-acyl-sn-glycerol-3-phosphate acyltransferase [Bacteriovoracaceae bacterium]
MISNVRAALKFLFFIVAILFYFAFTLPAFFLIRFAPFAIRKYLIVIMAIVIRSIMIVFNLKISYRGDVNELKKSRSRLIVANHMSYLDILIMASQKPACFVTSVEVREMPFLGQLSLVGGCLYVERRNKEKIHEEVQQLESALNSGLNIVIFPEATSTNGTEVLRFKRPLFNAAIKAKKDVLPLTINYVRINDTNVCINNRDLLCWYGDMEFLPHFWKFLKLKKVEVELTISPVISSDNTDMTKLSELAHSIVSKDYRPISC